jgi:phage terminase large subunit-like protein
VIQALNPDQLLKLRHEWSWWARDEQKPPPGCWRVWLYLAGRGAGKTRGGAEWIRASLDAGPTVVITRGTTYQNRANLAGA